MPVEAIAQDLLGLNVGESPDLEVSGMLLPASREVWLNAEESPARRRFTLAHGARPLGVPVPGGQAGAGVLPKRGGRRGGGASIGAGGERLCGGAADAGGGCAR